MLKKILPRSGVNKENTRYTTEGGWYDCDKVRFRQGTPEVIGGWQPLSTNTFIGVCRSLWMWLTLSGNRYTGVGTSKKFYLNSGSNYYDITPIRSTAALSGAFTASNGSSVITVAHTSHGASNGDYVTFYGAASLGGNVTASILNAEYAITYVSANSYTITVPVTANASATGHGGASITAVYQINTGLDAAVPLYGWGSSTWGSGTWGIGTQSTQELRLWSQTNFGQDLIFAPRGGGIYYWSSTLNPAGDTFTVTIASPAVFTGHGTYTNGTPVTFTSTGSLPTGLSIGTVYYIRNVSGVTFNVSTTPTGALINTSGAQSGTHTISPRAVNLTSIATASDVPTVQNLIFVSDTYRFVFAFGSNDYAQTTQNPMLARWSDQEDAGMWTPSATNQSGSLVLSHGSKVVTALQVRQEIVVLTDSTLYSLQYLGPPYIWGSQIMGDNLSVMGQNTVALASGVMYWMGVDKFYRYDGTVQTLRCDLRQYVFSNINVLQAPQIFAGTNEGFNEVWWFYCSSSSDVIDRYVVYNYGEDVWYHGSMGRTAWLDTGLYHYPIASTTSNTIVEHENGLNDNTTGTASAINAYITSSEFDIDDGHNFGFVWRVIPDLSFQNSTATSPQVTLTLQPLSSSGSGYNSPKSVGGESSASVTRTVSVPIEQYTGQVNIRVRGRQLSMKIESNQLDTCWQLGSMRLDIRQDGRRS